jgi:hypothetical protein
MIEWLVTRVLGFRMSPPPDVPPDSLPRDVTLRSGGLVPWIGGRLAGMRGPAAAVTLRRTIVVGPGVRLTPALLRHELAHVEQWRRDRLFPIRYAAANLRYGYDRNPYEIEARLAAASVSDYNAADRRTS